MNWTPRPSDIEWTRRLIDRLNDGGLWSIPQNGSDWRLDKKAKVFRCVTGPKDALFEQLTIIGKKLGYTTEYVPGSVPKHVLDAFHAGSGKTHIRTDLDRFSTTEP